MNQQTLATQNIPVPFNGPTPIQGFYFDFNLFSALRQTLRSRSQAMPITIMSRGDFIHMDTKWVLAALTGILVDTVWTYGATMVYTWGRPRRA